MSDEINRDDRAGWWIHSLDRVAHPPRVVTVKVKIGGDVPESCLFCHRTRAEVSALVMGQAKLGVCSECVAACVATLAEGR